MQQLVSLLLFFILFSCQNTIQISKLEIIDGKSFYNGDKYSGIAIKKDDLDNIRVDYNIRKNETFMSKFYLLILRLI